ncbi:MAG TPA: hypothetical protein VI299_11170 [Polyangiales bacterium]
MINGLPAPSANLSIPFMTRTHYDPQSTLRAARARYFLLNGFGPDGGYEARWVAFKVMSLPIMLPNQGGRRRAVRYHDLHHVLTGYPTDNVGEFEIAAWELAAGCGDYWAAWGLNVAALAGGCVTAPRRTFRAFVRGRASRSLYGEDLERVLDATVGEVRSELGLDAADSARPAIGDRVLFLALAGLGLWVGGGVLCVAVPLASLAMLRSQLMTLGRSVRTSLRS